jgi:hypothetical protein
VWALVLHRGAQPSGQTAFVISNSDADWKKGPPKKLSGLLAKDCDLIYRLQPFRRGPLVQIGWPAHPLAQLAFLSNTDKHKVLHPSFFVVDWPNGFKTAEEASQLVVPANATTGIADRVEVSAGIRYGDPLEVLRAHVPSPGPNPEMRPATGHTLRVAISGFYEALTLRHLTAMLHQVRLIVRMFEFEL